MGANRVAANGLEAVLSIKNSYTENMFQSMVLYSFAFRRKWEIVSLQIMLKTSKGQIVMNWGFIFWLPKRIALWPFQYYHNDDHKINQVQFKGGILLKRVETNIHSWERRLWLTPGQMMYMRNTKRIRCALKNISAIFFINIIMEKLNFMHG